MSLWKLKDCCLSISDGDHLPPPKTDSGIPFITISNIDSTNHIDFGNTLFVPIEYYEKLDDIRKARPNDIIYSVVGSFGKPVLIKDDRKFVFQRHIAILRPNSEIVDSRFLYYVMLSRDFYMQADTVAIGAAQRTISLSSLRNMKVELPSLPIQHRIATILSRYDTLIENYQKQIKLLEEAAQRLYKEWFVDLRFPGHENTKMVDGLPEGWERKMIDDVCVSISSGSTPSRNNKNYWENGTIKWVKTKELQDGWILDTEEYITQDGYNNSSTKMFPENTVLMAIYASPTLGRLGVLATECCCNQAALGLIADDAKISWQWLFWKLYELRDDFNSIARGAGQQNISGIVIKNKVIVVPDKPIIDAFTSAVSKMFEKQKNISSQIRLLAEARDRLLPRLMDREFFNNYNIIESWEQQQK